MTSLSTTCHAAGTHMAPTFDDEDDRLTECALTPAEQLEHSVSDLHSPLSALAVVRSYSGPSPVW